MPLHILVADAHRGMRDSLRVVLETDGYRVTTVVDGPRALSAIARDLPHLVLTDLALPIIDGVALRRRLQLVAPAMPVVFMSASVAVLAAARAHQAAGALVKPFETDALLATLTRLLTPPPCGHGL
jgi:two-component system, OmpR family, response regulator MprA